MPMNEELVSVVRDILGSEFGDSDLTKYDEQLSELSDDEMELGTLTREEALLVAAELRRQERRSWVKSVHQDLIRAARESGQPVVEPNVDCGLVRFFQENSRQGELLLRALSRSVTARHRSTEPFHVRRGYLLARPISYAEASAVVTAEASRSASQVMGGTNDQP